MRYVLLSFFLFLSACGEHFFKPSNQATIRSSIQSPMLDFAIDKLDASLHVSQQSIPPINLQLSLEKLEPQAFQIKSTTASIDITAGDIHGLMYGLLELEEYIALQQDVSELSISQIPFIKKRGLKFNIPLDARNPSYDDTGDAAQNNIASVWDFDFWQQQLDEMALHRYNQLTLWNPQPFTSLLKLEAFPGLALDDVYRSSEPLSEKWTSWGEPGGVSANVLSKLELVKKITIDEKILFWKKVFAYAKDRGIDVHLITWSIYPNGIDAKHGISSEIDNEKTQAFFREAVKELVLTYPNLKGVGVTAGENMPVDGTVGNWSREKWLWETYGRGLAEAKAVNPDRSIDFMHRFWYSGYEDIEKYWGDYPDHFSFSFKYIMARMYSSSAPSHIAENVLPYLAPEAGRRTWWNLRNDDIYVFRWGNPDYARTFYNNLPITLTEGIHMGSDGYVWGRVFADKSDSMNQQLEIEKHWYSFMMWGRLAYNNELPRSFFENKLQHHFEIEEAGALYDAWAAASEIVPQINRFQFRPGDRQFSPESSSSRETFRYVNDFQVATPMPKSGIINPREYVQIMLGNKNTEEAITPLDVADNLEQKATWALTLTERFSNHKKETLSLTIEDIKAMSHLGLYYAAKIRAAVALEFFEKGAQKQEHHEQAASIMRTALEHWQSYRSIATRNYHPQMLARTGKLDWEKLEKEVEYEVQLVQQKLTRPFVIPATNDPENRLSVSYNTGQLKGEARHASLKVSTPDAGEYMLEVYEEDGVLISNYHSFGNGPMRWEWLQEQNGIYYLNLIWQDINRVIQVDKRVQRDI